MALPKFYLVQRKNSKSKCPIVMFFSFNGKRIQYYTGINIEPRFYKNSDSKGKAIPKSEINRIISESAPYSRIIKETLNQIAIDVQNIVLSAKVNKITITKEFLTEELDKIHKIREVISDQIDFVSYYEKYLSDCKEGKRLMLKGKSAGKRYSFNAIKNYASTLSAIKRFMIYKRIKKLEFNQINKEFYEGFRSFCYKIEHKRPSTFAGFIKDIKVIMNEANEDHIDTGNGHKSSSFLIPSYETDAIFLSEEQIDLIAKLDLSNRDNFVTHLVPARDRLKKKILDKLGNTVFITEKISYHVLEKARDMSLIGFYTALRFSNFSNLDLKSINENFINVKQVKGGNYISIPILNKLRPVLAKYPDKLPTLSLQKFNIYIKLIAELAGLTEIVKIRSFKGNEEIVLERRLCDLVSSHCCRRSYATNMFKRGIPTMLIMAATGHTTEAKYLLYIRASNEDKSKLMAEALKKLGI